MCDKGDAKMDKSSTTRTGNKATHLIKNIFQLVLRQRRALDILDRPQLLGHPLPILSANRVHTLLQQLFLHLWIIAEIGLGADDEARYPRAMMVDFGEPFLADVLK